MADGGLLAPCENFSGTIGSVVTHRLRDLWKGPLTQFPNQACMGCGKQRFRLEGFKNLGGHAKFLWKRKRGQLDWYGTKGGPIPASPAASDNPDAFARPLGRSRT